MNKNLQAAPYYDDYDSASGFHQILFKPGYSVQARELTQLQSIIRDQVAKFGSHVFKHGSVVIPGNSTSDLNLCFVTLAATTYNVATLVDKDVTGSTTGLRAKIRYGVAQGTNPAKIYVSYYNTGSAGQRVFADGETLIVDGVATTFAAASTSATGGASMAFVNDGVFYVNGTFVTVNSQRIVMSDTVTPSCHVLLKIDETIVSSSDDETLLDPAQGSYNFAAPGADRLKITLTLVTLPLGAPFAEDFVELMRFENGVLLEHSRYPKYNELEKSLARRTHDESGDYVVSGLTVSLREHLKEQLNGGKFDVSQGGDRAKMIFAVQPGKAYVKGFEIETLAPVDLIVDKARTTNVINANMVPSFGQFLYVSDIVSLPNFKNREQITFYNAKTAGSIIGTANVIAIDYHESNTTDANVIYKIFISNVSVTGGNDVADIGRITFTGGSATVLQKHNVAMTTSTDFVLNEVVTAGTRVATVHKFSRANNTLYTFKHAAASDTPTVNDSLTAPSTAAGKTLSVETLGRNTSDNLLIELPSASTYRVKNASNASDISYKLYYQTDVNITGGTGSFSVSGMTIDPKEAGNFIIASAAGLHPLSTATVAGDGLSVSFAGITPTSTTLKVICAATKTAAQATPKTKTLVQSHSEAGLVVSSTVQLSMADVVKIRSIVSTVDGDVTNRFRLDNGQRDYAYLRGSLILVGSAPTGTLTVIYDYFNHNAGSGDYFSIDSYEASGLSDYYDSTVYNYVSTNTGKSYDLRDVLDFRSRVGTDGTFTGVGNSTNYAPQVDSRITTSIQQYIGRIDAVVMSKDGQLSVLSGTPSESPRAPNVANELLYLASVVLPAYTFSISDARVIKQNNRVYTMRDVGNIDRRLSEVEDLVLLSETEQSVINFDVIDSATGLSRFKSGYLVDGFSDADKISAIDDPKFSVAYVSEKIVPKFEIAHVPLTVVSTTTQATGDVITLPYTHVALATQPMSSRVTNVNPFAVFSWKGSLALTPSKDVWVEVVDLPATYTSSSETITVNRWGQVVGGGSSGGWGGGGSKVICAELYRQGLMDEKIYVLDELFGVMMGELEPNTIKGYHTWANGVVKLMQKSHVATNIVNFFAKPWSMAMAKHMGYGEGSKFGTVIMIGGLNICRLIGKIIK